MDTAASDLLTGLSAALAARVASGAPNVVALGADHRARTGLLWRPDVVVASEQSLPQRDSFSVTLSGGATAKATVAGRDRGTNIVALRLDRPAGASALPPADAPAVGALVLALGADGTGGTSARLGLVRRAGPGWHSLAGGRIDQLIGLDMTLAADEEGGPVLDASGGLLGMSTLGPRGRVLVIPCATIGACSNRYSAKAASNADGSVSACNPVILPEEARAPSAARPG